MVVSMHLSLLSYSLGFITAFDTLSLIQQHQMAAEVAADLEQRYEGFKPCFGGEELKRACATLSGALVDNKLQPPLAQLSQDPDLHVRELAFAARQYAGASGADLADYDSLYNHGLVLQELSGRLPAASAEQAAMLRQACRCYELALGVKPTSHAALYNWGVALSDLARCIKATDAREATAALHLASQKYALSLQLQPRNPQALNNWGLVLQELSGDARDWGQRDALVHAAMEKFRLTIRTRPDFDRGCYNLGTVFYTAAMALQGEAEGGSSSSKQSKDVSVRTLLAGAAQYICLAHALQPSKEIYRKSLAVVRQMLPLPFLRAGFLTAPRARSIGSVTETYRRDWFVLDQRSLRQASHMETSLSTAGAGVLSSQQRAAAGPGAGAGAVAAAVSSEEEPLVLPLSELLAVRRCAEPSLPEGAGIWVSTQAMPAGIYLVADDADSADAWVDALVLCQHLVGAQCSDALEEALAPLPARRSKHAAGMAS